MAQNKEIQEKDLGNFINDFERFQSSASIKRQHRSKQPQGKGPELSKEKILNMDKNKLVFFIYWQNVKKIARKYRNAYFYELSLQSLEELQREALADQTNSEEIQSLVDQIKVMTDGIM